MAKNPECLCGSDHLDQYAKNFQEDRMIPLLIIDRQIRGVSAGLLFWDVVTIINGISDL